MKHTKRIEARIPDHLYEAILELEDINISKFIRRAIEERLRKISRIKQLKNKTR